MQVLQGIGYSERRPGVEMKSCMAQRSEGATLRANIALLENNARVAALIASELSQL